jgi:S-adenosyl-L-methionine hydrolase (adenosine-forming)
MMQKKPTIALTTDFGADSHYVGAIKAVIASIAPKAKVIDLTHTIPPYDIVSGAFILGTNYLYFPKDTIHVAVVDPGVGSTRKPILARNQYAYFIGPDNGLFSLVERRSTVFDMYELDQPKYFLDSVSSTFHGRDIFAPVAAHLAKGVSPKKLGTSLKTFEMLEAFDIEDHGTRIVGEVLMVDGFGNVIVNIDNDYFSERVGGKPFSVHIHDQVAHQIIQTYSDSDRGSLVALFGSSGFMELAISQGSLASQIPVAVGDEVRIEINT